MYWLQANLVRCPLGDNEGSRSEIGLSNITSGTAAKLFYQIPWLKLNFTRVYTHVPGWTFKSLVKLWPSWESSSMESVYFLYHKIIFPLNIQYKHKVLNFVIGAFGKLSIIIISASYFDSIIDFWGALRLCENVLWLQTVGCWHFFHWILLFF